MKNKKLIAGIGCGVLVAALVIGIVAGNNKGNDNTNTDKNILQENIDKNNENDQTNNQEDLPIVRESDGLHLTIDDENLAEIKRTMNKYNEVYITKQIETVERGKIDDEYVYDNRQELKKYGLEYIMDASRLYTYDVLEIEQIAKKQNVSINDSFLDNNKLNPNDIFYINPTDYDNLYDLSLGILKKFNITADNFQTLRLDDELYDSVYETYHQKMYVCNLPDNFNLSIVNLNKDDYDQILSKRLLLHTNLDYDGEEYIEYISASVCYTKNNEKKENEMIINIVLYNDGAYERMTRQKCDSDSKCSTVDGGVCSCGSDAGCSSNNTSCNN